MVNTVTQMMIGSWKKVEIAQDLAHNQRGNRAIAPMKFSKTL